MATDYSEKRNFFRMNLDCTAEYIINGSGNKQIGVISDLSGDGISIIASESVKPGTEVRVSIKPESDVTPPLEVVMEVLRCDAQAPDSFVLAGNITKR